ncbi:MASE1 domain-containing protein [Zavarzinella formosa]|uniref:MASE1 domain-containing protein n=1 Tax=Zavarzinella formosa TaxID=360055 RepID=UPI0002D998CE|nr:MASE1 domain-containing protein [Zavarzinella formosa]
MSAIETTDTTAAPPPARPSVRPFRYFIEILLFAAVYYAVGKLGLLLCLKGCSTPIWIPTGLSLAFIWFRDWRYLPGITLGALLVDVTTEVSWWAGVIMATGNTLEAWAGVWLLRKAGFCPRLERMRDVVALVALPMVFSTLISALFGAVALALSGGVALEDFVVWWLGNALSVVVVAPLLMTWRKGGIARLAGRPWREILLVFAGLFGATIFAFTMKSSDPHDFMLLVLTVPFLTAVALRHGPRGTTAAVFSVSIIAILGTVGGTGPFNSDTLISSITRLDVFLAVIGIQAMIVCSLMQERKRTESTLRTEHSTFTYAESLAKIGSWQCDIRGKFIWWSDETYRMCGLPVSESPGTKEEFIAQYVHPDDREQVLRETMLAAECKTPCYVCFRLVMPDGRVKHIEWQGRSRFLSDGTFIEYIGTMQDITERVAAGEALKASESRYRLLADHASDVITRQSMDGTFLYLSPSITNLMGFSPEEMVGRMPFEFIHPDDASYVRKAKEGLTEAVVTLTFRVRHKAGHYPWVELCGSIIQPQEGEPEIICQLRDISERKRLEEQIQQSQKMEAIGRLAGGIAHDFNNLLTVINGFSEVLAEMLPESSPALPLVTDIRQAGLRAAGLTKQLLAFSRRQLVSRRVMDLNEAVKNSHSLLTRLIREDIRLGIVPSASRAAILADPGQIDLVVMNLVVNARDAMPAGGEITMTVSHHTVVGEGELGEMPAGEYVVLSVADTGDGIDDATKTLIFEPFFTTKEQGKGTGLGLATVYAIMQQSRGRITVESEIGRGTTFRLFWPAEESPFSSFPPEKDQVIVNLGDGEVILVVEDDDSVRNLTSRVLRDRGYRVLEAGDGLEAMRLCERRGMPVDLVVTDVVMPHMNGRELAGRLQRMWPHVPILFLSGYTNDAILRQHIREQSVVLLTKPFSAESLLNKVRELLDDKPVRTQNADTQS